MRAVVDAKEFSQALDKVSKVLRRSSIPTLGEVLVQFANGRCILTGTNLDTWLMAEFPARGDDLAFVFHRTADAAKVCRRFDGELSFELTETGAGRDRRLRLYMSSGHRAGELYALFPEDYPELPELEPECSFDANAATLLERINRIKYATLRPGECVNMLSTSIQFSDNRIFCLDGYRAAWDTDNSLTAPVPFIAQVASLEYLKLLGHQDILVQLGKRYVDISSATLRLRFRRVEGRLFHLDNAIPRQFQNEISVCPQDFLAELTYLKEAAPSTQKSYVHLEGGRLSMQVDGCSYQTEIHMDGDCGFPISFNIHYLADALKQFKGEPRVRMKLSSPISPVILEAEGRGDRALLLPVRMKNNMAA